MMKMNSKLFEEVMEWTIAIVSALMLVGTAMALGIYLGVI